MKEIMILHTISLALGILLDQIIGDPQSFPHPIRAIGNLILFLEKKFLGNNLDNENRNPEKEKRRGVLLWLIVMVTTITAVMLLMIFSYKINKYLGVMVEAVLTCYILAARSLCRESMLVHKALKAGNTTEARRALSMIVGRDTEHLDEEEITKAAVETVAENTSDGVIAPLLYTALGGPVLGMAYKAVNTMDSMLGYHNDRYEYFGRFAAKADDFFNYLPSRLSALLMIVASALAGLSSAEFSGKGAYKIWIRDRYNHKSPNSAQTESVCAGALGLKLGGTHLYKGVPVEKPTIGDERRKPEIDDIQRANHLMFLTEALTFGLVLCVIALAYLIPGKWW
jgi:adenosylcobinamide-phosphate synthase